MFGQTTAQVTAPTYLPAFTLNEVTLKSVEIIELPEGKGKALNLNFENKDGAQGRQSFRPLGDSATTRTSGDYGDQPSELEQFETLVGQFMKALVPDTYAKFVKGEIEIVAESFEEYIEILSGVYKTALDGESANQVYFLKTGKDGYLTKWPASINKEGELVATTNVISRNISDVQFNKYELKQKNKANNAASQTASPFGAMGGESIDGETPDNLPF